LTKDRAIPGFAIPLLAAALGFAASGAGAASCIVPLPAAFDTAAPSPVVAKCSARTPADGRWFSGPVLQVMDGQTLCVALGPTPAEWVQVRIAGIPPQSTRQALLAASFGRTVVCSPTNTPASDPEARCTVEGAALDTAVTAGAVHDQTLTWR
jgi:hypothetical protein